ncbi:LysR family transcriptional regulator [Leisingera sp. D0M16]|uniref:LysR family transcriptional regulator n=1 Tax=Leisingera coralii TaxID=3351347 RepID=UPI003B7BB6BC
MQLEAIETFLAIVETGGFHAAARQQGITQTTASARIRSLEAAVNNRLFERGAGGTKLTAFGQEFQPFAEEMISLWKIASSDLAERLSNRTALRIGAQLSIWDPLLVDLTIELERSFGKLLFALNFDHILNVSDAVMNHILDIALTHEEVSDPRVSCRELPPEQLAYVETPGASEQEEPLFINLELGKEYQHYVESVTAQSERQSLFLGNCMMGLRYLLRRGGRGLFPQYVVDDHLEAGRLQVVQGAEALSLPCYLLHRAEGPSDQQIADVISCLSTVRGHS